MTPPFIIAQLTDISSVPATSVKDWFLMAAFALGLYLMARRSRQPTGAKDDPTHLGQPVEIKKHAEYAPKEETAKELKGLRERMEAMQRENQRQHNAQAAKLNDKLNEIMETGGRRGNEILTAIHAIKDDIRESMTTEVKALHERINPLAEQVAAHKQAITWIKSQLTSLFETLRHLHSRVDDAIRLAMGRKS